VGRGGGKIVVVVEGDLGYNGAKIGMRLRDEWKRDVNTRKERENSDGG
jgi:hypothetical protein